MFYQDKLVLVAGGSGFVGTNIVLELLKQGARVRVPVHDRPNNVQDERVETMQADLTNYKECLAAVKGVDYVINAAGAVAAAGVNTSNPMYAITTNLILSALIFQAALEKSDNIQGFLVLSSHTGYPLADYPLKEEEYWSGPTHASYFGYGWMRRYLERMGEFVASKSKKMKVVTVRPTATYGRYDDFDPVTSHVVPALIRKAVERMDPYEVWGTGDEVRDFLHASDLARGSLIALEKCESCDPINIGYGQVVTIKDIVHAILDAAGYGDAKIEFNSDRPTTIPYRLVDTSKAKRVLGFEPELTLQEGIKDTVDWYIENKDRLA
jgi:GDP-L-fucose synthase